MARLHGLEAIEHAEKHGGELMMYGNHEPGQLAGLEFNVIEIENPDEDFARLRALCEAKPFLIYIDVEESNADTQR